MYDLIVVGAGVVGSVLTSMARLQGLNVLLVSEGQPSSAAALAVLRRSWTQRETDEALSWYELNGGVRHGATVSWAARPDVKWQDDWHLVDPKDVLLQPDLNASVRSFHGGGIVTASGAHERATQVVVSKPVWSTDTPASYGATAVSRDVTLTGEGWLRVHWLRPYHAIMAAQTGGELRVGSSVSDSPVGAGLRVMQMVEQLAAAGVISSREGPWEVRHGSRHAVTLPVQQPDGTILLGGFGRLGYTCAPALAKQLLDLMARDRADKGR